MCSIFGSFDLNEVRSLKKLNDYRGNLTSSISYVDKNSIDIYRFDHELTDIKDIPTYKLCHQQAPTSAYSTSHPSEYKNSFLWHNGLLKHDYINFLRNELKVDYCWDTKLLHILIKDYGIEALNEVQGSFSCAYYNNNNLIIFRNSISTMFIENSTISSTKFVNSVSTKYNIVYLFDYDSRSFKDIDSFNNIETPFKII